MLCLPEDLQKKASDDQVARMESKSLVQEALGGATALRLLNRQRRAVLSGTYTVHLGDI